MVAVHEGGNGQEIFRRGLAATGTDGADRHRPRGGHGVAVAEGDGFKPASRAVEEPALEDVMGVEVVGVGVDLGRGFLGHGGVNVHRLAARPKVGCGDVDVHVVAVLRLGDGERVVVGVLHVSTTLVEGIVVLSAGGVVLARGGVTEDRGRVTGGVDVSTAVDGGFRRPTGGR